MGMNAATLLALSSLQRTALFVVVMAALVGFVVMAFGPALAGFWVTLRQMLPGHRVTTQYPEQKRVKPQRFHGRHVLNRYPDGMEKCIGCELCAGVCPARCIYVRGKENPADAPVSGSGSSTRSTCCVASSAGCAWRRVPPRPSP